ncbi:hypothetical protein [Streptomyces sp. SLBN-31]|uniref:hypothetical protein n=1 Tax=Streptomyces sp. SLBN-31 TaxID=2768444 RepID=UPI0021B3DFA2|nr:hypothetical protein [Streptomyces sp. SLBN-31]
MPGPFYGAETDNCGTGRIHAPGLVLCKADHFTEYVYRQPRTAEELRQLVEAAEAEVFSGYGCDGDIGRRQRSGSGGATEGGSVRTW